MSTALLAAEVELSKQLNDYWSSTSTSTGSTTTIKDTALMAKSNQWIDGDAQMYDQITSGICDTEERKISSLDNSTGSTGTLTTLAHSSTGIAASVTYRVHRLFTGADKRQALLSAAKLAYPHIFKYVRDESLVSGNWLKDGSFEIWTTSTNLTYWTETTTTVTQISTVGLFKHGSYSAALTGTAGTVAQSLTNNADLIRLAGKSVTFSVQVKASATSSVRISIYDGTDYTYSDYNDQITGWTGESEPLEVTATIQDHPSAITFSIHYVSGTVYVDDARVISEGSPRIYIGNLGLAKNTPHAVFVESGSYSNNEPWVRIHDVDYDTVNGYMFLPDTIPPDYRLRVEGIGYLDFLTSGVHAETLVATIEVDSPQLEILVAQAALYLCKQKIMPNYTTGEVKQWQESYQFWQMELAQRIRKFGMTSPGVTASWGA